MHTNQNGMILVLAMFMLALLSMIGIASMMTSTTDIEIATGERQYVETFYRSQASHTIAGELLQSGKWDRGLGGADTMDPYGNPADMEDITDYTFAFRAIHPDFMREDEDSVIKTLSNGQTVKVWQADEQTEDELPCPAEMGALACKELDAQIGTQDLDLWTDVRLVRLQKDLLVTVADIDIDKIQSIQLAGGGAEFGSKDLGIGSSSTATLYNIDARSRLATGDFYKSPSRQSLGFRVVN